MAKDGSGREFGQNNLFWFEVREPTAEDWLEVLRRAAVQAHLAEEYDDAASAADAMLSLHARSWHAYEILGDVARAQRKVADARQSYSKAIELLMAGSDDRDVRIRESISDHSISDIVWALRGRLALLDRLSPR